MQHKTYRTIKTAPHRNPAASADRPVLGWAAIESECAPTHDRQTRFRRAAAPGLLRKTRIRAGLTQVDLAKRIGETQSFISKVERGERRLDIVELRAMCAALGITLAEFVTAFEAALAKARAKRVKKPSR